MPLGIDLWYQSWKHACSGETERASGARIVVLVSRLHVFVFILFRCAGVSVLFKIFLLGLLENLAAASAQHVGLVVQEAGGGGQGERFGL